MIAFAVRNLFVYAGQVLRLPDDTRIVYHLDGTWQVRKWTESPCFYVGELLVELYSAIEMATWLNRNQVRGEHE